MDKIEKFCRKHFNEPVITTFHVVRLIGYAEDDEDCYYIVRYPYGTRHTSNSDGIVWESAVGGLMTLRGLLKQDVVIPRSGEHAGQVLKTG